MNISVLYIVNKNQILNCSFITLGSLVSAARKQSDENAGKLSVMLWLFGLALARLWWSSALRVKKDKKIGEKKKR